MELTPENKLFHGYINGENKALEEIFISNFTSLVLTAYKYTSSEDDAQDIVSEVFCVLCELNVEQRKLKFSKFSGKLKALIASMVRNKAIDFYRAPRNKKRSNNGELENDSLNLFTNDVYFFGETIEEMITSLTEKEKAIFSLYFDGYKSDEIAEKIGLAEKTVQNSISLIKNKLRKQWENHDA
jgi:RNA polymerase sigma factor (sigma-70 family)